MKRSGRLGIAAVAAAMALLGWWLSRGPEAPEPPAVDPVASVEPAEAAEDVPATDRPRAAALTPSAVRPAASDPAGVFAGRVLSATTGEGIAGAELTFERAGTVFTSRSGVGGAFEFRPSHTGAHRLAAITAAGFLAFGPEWGHSPVSLIAIEGQRVEGLAFFLSPSIELRGVVVAGKGVPVADAEVTVTDAAQAAVSSPSSALRSGADGSFVFRASEGAELRARHPGHGPGRATVGPRAFLGEPVRIELSTAGSRTEANAVISGRVVDAQSQPAPEALLTATRRRRVQERFIDDLDRPPAHATADAEGHFRFEGLEPGRYDIRAYLEGVGRGTKLAIPAPREDLVVRLDPGAKVRGSVRQADTGAPVAAFTVELQRMRGSLGRDSFLTTSVIRSDGQFELEGVAPGRYSLQVAAHGFALSEERELTVEDPPVDVGPIDLRLERGGSVHGVVRSEATKRAVANAIVSLEGGVDASSSALPVTARTTTDASGRFELGGLAEGLRSITVMAQGHHGRVLSGLQVQNDGTIGPLEVTLNPVEPGEEPRIELVGIGAVLTPKVDVLLIGRVLPGGGAAEAGLSEGDELLQIDGVRISALGFEGAVNRIRGPEGSTVALLVRRRGEAEPREVVVRRTRIRS